MIIIVEFQLYARKVIIGCLRRVTCRPISCRRHVDVLKEGEG